MQLVFEVCDTASGEAPLRKVFDRVGGFIGRGAGCDWVIPDATRLLSSHHALIGYRDGQYFLTDVSSNGIGVAGGMERLRKGQARLIADGEVYQLGALDIRAHLRPRWTTQDDRQALACADTIPDDAFLGLDPMHALAHEQRRDECCEELDALAHSVETPTCSFAHSAVERDHLTVPRWAQPPKRMPPLHLTQACPSCRQPSGRSLATPWACGWMGSIAWPAKRWRSKWRVCSDKPSRECSNACALEMS